MGRSEIERLISRLIVLVQQENYEKAREVLVILSENLSSLTPEEAAKLDRLLAQFQGELKLKEQSILKSLSNRDKVRGSYLKCSS